MDEFIINDPEIADSGIFLQKLCLRSDQGPKKISDFIKISDFASPLISIFILLLSKIEKEIK